MRSMAAVHSDLKVLRSSEPLQDSNSDRVPWERVGVCLRRCRRGCRELSPLRPPALHLPISDSLAGISAPWLPANSHCGLEEIAGVARRVTIFEE